MRSGVAIWIVFLFLLPLPFTGIGSGVEEDRPVEDGILDQARETIRGSTGVFMENKGQWDPSILFVATTSYGKVALANDGIYHQLMTWEEVESDLPWEHPQRRVKDSCLVKILFEGGSPQSVRGIDPVETKYNFFLGNDSSRWATDVHGYDEVFYEDVWSGIDIRYYHKDGNLKYDIILEPGADPLNIGMIIEGAKENIGSVLAYITV